MNREEWPAEDGRDMRTWIEEMTGDWVSGLTPEAVAGRHATERGTALLRTGSFDSPGARYSMVAVAPFRIFSAYGSRCRIEDEAGGGVQEHFGNPWQTVSSLVARYEVLDEVDSPFPLGGCFGYWGYDLRQFLEPRIGRRAAHVSTVPDCFLAFHDSVAVFDHRLGRVWVVATGLSADGSRSERAAEESVQRWKQRLRAAAAWEAENDGSLGAAPECGPLSVTLNRSEFVKAVERAQQYIRSGDIYQVNLARRFSAAYAGTGWDLYERLREASPAPYSAFLQGGDFQLVSSSPELFLRMSGAHLVTRPIKGTRPRSADPLRDAQWTYELQTSAKEMAELVMITDLLRNDLGRVCEYGSVTVPELVRLERFAQVQHLVSTVEGRLRPEWTHVDALQACFPGGSITGAPKFRAMDIIDELEPVSRGVYCGCHGYIGFNRESQFSITIRSAVVSEGRVEFHVGAGIVADSKPEAEWAETNAKARGLLAALRVGEAKLEQSDAAESGNRWATGKVWNDGCASSHGP